VIFESTYVLFEPDRGEYQIALQPDRRMVEAAGAVGSTAEEAQAALSRDAVALLAWAELVATGYLHSAKVETVERVSEKTVRLKPWLARPPHFVAIDIESAPGTYGMPRGHIDERHRPTPHWRRGHIVTLRAERYGDNRGKTIWRRPAWVGPESWEWSGQIYTMATISPIGASSTAARLPLAPPNRAAP
jgi:hypothetical protein